MDKINLNLFNKLSFKGLNQKEEEKVTKDEQQKTELTPKEDKSSQVLDALYLTGLQNRNQIKQTAVDPTKYLSAERIAEIENSMVSFTSKTEEYVQNILKEFPGISQTQAYSLAAEALARNI